MREFYFRSYSNLFLLMKKIVFVLSIHKKASFIGNQELESTWLVENFGCWADYVDTFAGVAHRHPQTAYSGLKLSLQQDLDFIHRFTPGVGEAFRLVEEAL